MTTRTALVVGATGLVGENVVAGLVQDHRTARVITLVRRPPPSPQSDKVTNLVANFEQVGKLNVGPIDDVYLCLGTTMKQAGSEAAFRHVDRDLTVAVASLAKAAGATRAALVSSVGAHPRSSSFYLRVKAEAERDVAALGFEVFAIARPSFLLGTRAVARTGEALGIRAAGVLSWAFVGPLAKYHPISATAVANALIHATAASAPGTQVLEYAALNAAASA